MCVVVMRSQDTSQLYLLALPGDRWQVANVIPSGQKSDGDVRSLRGCQVTAAAVLRWAAGRLSSALLRETGDPIAHRHGRAE